MLVDGNESVARTARRAFQCADAVNDQPTADLLTQRLDVHEKNAWMLRSLLEDWRGTRHEGASASEIARLAIEEALVVSHRRLFGVMFWFVLLPGPSGAVMYRLAGLLAEAYSGIPGTEPAPGCAEGACAVDAGESAAG